MTDERINEIWALLTPKEKAKIIYIYNNSVLTDWDRGYNAALEYIFGYDNLTAPAEECKTSQNNSLDVAENVKTSTEEDVFF